VSQRIRAGPVIAGIIGTMGLAYPACAAICPKGHGSCPYPGKCFLYTDADANSVCDYTRTASDGLATQNTAATTPAAVPSAGTGTSASPAAVTDAGLTAIFQQNALIIGIALFAVLAIVLFTIFRSGRFGKPLAKTGVTLALSSFISLGISEIVTYVLMGDAASGTESGFAAVYLIAGSVHVAYLWKSGAIVREVVLALAGESVIFGLVLNVLIMPAEFAGLLGVALGSRTIAFGAMVILAIMVLTFITSRTFCAHICPVGSIQELAYCLPKDKIRIRNSRTLEAIRLVVTVCAVIAALAGIDLISFTGAYDFFSLTISVWAGMFVLLLILAVVLYRPICRAICPFGLIFAGIAHMSRFRLQRTDVCIGCKKCEKACPAGAAGADDPKRECYLCARCTQTCPVPGALTYGKRNT